jgi:La domain
MSGEPKREEQVGGDAIDRDGGIPPPRRTDNVPTEIVGNGSGSPDMSDTSVSSSRSSTASNAEHHPRPSDGDDINGTSSSNGLKTPSPPPVVLTQLARQLEYYFSSRNLAKDTYVQTLRALNDGCVPVAILANFAKVKAMLVSASNDVGGGNDDEEEGRFHAILQAAAEHSDLLRVCSIETSTGKIATDDTPSSASTILAVGPVGSEPLRLGEDEDAVGTDGAMRTAHSLASFGSYHESPFPTTLGSPGGPGSSPTNTIILREVHPDVAESEIRELFGFEGCPPIESVRPDVAHCWYVTSSTTTVTMITFVLALTCRISPSPVTAADFAYPGSSLWTRRRATTCCEL